jgi:Caspase domain
MNDAKKRVALVIGNSDYKDGNDVSGVEDAKAIAECLGDLGFKDPLLILNGNLKAASDALDDFGNQIADAAVALFFYSGHGFQSEGKSFLLPPGGPVSPAGSLLLDDVLQKLGLAPDDSVKFAFLDACRNDKRLPVGAPKGLADPSEAPLGMLQSFAASPGQVAASGSADGLSPYTMALLQYLREPGLELGKLFAKVRAFVPRPQQPIEAGAMPESFFFRDPVFVRAEIPGGHSDLLVILHGDVVVDIDQPLMLNAGGNELVLLVSNGRTHRNGHDWDRTEGWSYQLNLVLPDGTMKSFEGHEEVPFKDGPHFGKVFTVARALIQVDPKTAEVTIPKSDMDIWNREAPFWAQDQELLFQLSIRDLNLSPDEILADAVNLGSVAPILRPFLVELLKSGTILGAQIADPEKTFVTVRGNRALKRLVEVCMTTGRADRISDLKASIAAAFNRNPRPFDLFDQGLIAALRSAAQDPQNQASTIPTDDIRVWTALEDRSHEPPAIAEPTTNAVEAGMSPELVHQS